MTEGTADRMNDSTRLTETPMLESEMPALSLWRRGKVRDVYDLGTQLLVVASDRISAYDCIMPQPIPGKGRMLTTVSSWWFENLTAIGEHHLVSSNPDDYPDVCTPYRDQLEGRSMLVEKTEPLPVECVVRGYLAGSGTREYIRSGTVCGVSLPPGLESGSRLPEPIFTPATKAEEGHDENITFDRVVEILDRETAEHLRSRSLAIYNEASTIAARQGLIIADTKFEFGRRSDGTIIVIDEVLTPDSSRFWLAEEYRAGTEPVNFDKQYLRDWLETLDWDKTPPAPDLPKDVVEGTAERYRRAMQMLTESTPREVSS